MLITHKLIYKILRSENECIRKKDGDSEYKIKWFCVGDQITTCSIM